MIPPDRDIYEIEKRIAERRHRVEGALRDTGRQTLRALTSPWALGAAALAGFLLAGGLRRRRERPVERRRTPHTAVKASTLSSLAMAAATWVIRSQFGSPVDMARFVVSKVKSQKEEKRPPPAKPSSLDDMIRKRREAAIQR